MKKKKPQKKSKTNKPKDIKDKHDLQDDAKSFDFGGLPDRDLKKNLGCG